MTPLTKNQWKSVLLNSLFAFIAVFLPALAASGSLDRTALLSAASAGFMAAFKIVEKALKTE